MLAGRGQAPALQVTYVCRCRVGERRGRDADPTIYLQLDFIVSLRSDAGRFVETGCPRRLALCALGQLDLVIPVVGVRFRPLVELQLAAHQTDASCWVGLAWSCAVRKLH